MKPNGSPPETDVAKAFQLALTLSQMRQTETLQTLDFDRRVLKALKEMPKLKPPVRPLKLSEIAPTLPKYEEEAVPEEEKEGVITGLKKRLKRKFGRGVPA